MISRLIQPPAKLYGYSLVFDFNALAEAEAATGHDLLLKHPGAILQNLTAAGLRGLLKATLSARHPEITAAAAGAMIRPDTMTPICEAICEAWILSMPKQERSGRRQRKPPESSRVWEMCYAAARVRLGMSDEQFGRTTPRQLRLLLDEYGEIREERKQLVGLLASVVANFSQCHPEEPLKPSDFFTGMKEPKQRNNAAQEMATTRAFLMSQVTRRFGPDGKEEAR